jgi:hypothetical protein
MATSELALAISLSCIPMSPSRASARTVSESMRTPILSLGATSSSIACIIEGTPASTITLPIQKPGAPDTLLRMRSAPLGDAHHAQARLVHLGAGRLHPFVQNGERARIAVDRHAERLRHALRGNVTMGRPIPPVVKTYV